MVNDQLLSYIRQNLAAGLAQADIEKALLAAGWQASDITAGFASINSPAAATPAIVTSPLTKPASQPTVDANADETARIQKEVELEAKRHKWRGATTSTPGIGGIIGWMISKKLARDEVQANLILIGVAILAIALTVWINWPHAPKGGPTTEQLEASIKAMQTAHPSS